MLKKGNCLITYDNGRDVRVYIYINAVLIKPVIAVVVIFRDWQVFSAVEFLFRLRVASDDCLLSVEYC